MAKVPFKYYGGKARMAKRIAESFPDHDVYVEPFCGSAAVLFAKERSGVECINDINGEAVEFFRALRDRPNDLVRECMLTPYSRKEFKEPTGSTAAQWFTKLNQGFSGGTGGWSFSRKQNPPMTWARRAAALYECADRLCGVHIECDDAINVINRWDCDRALFYVDPPYVGARQDYRCDKYTGEHLRELCSVLDSISGKFVLSGYENEESADIIPGHWSVTRIEVKSSSATSKLGKSNARVECLWSKDLAMECNGE